MFCTEAVILVTISVVGGISPKSILLPEAISAETTEPFVTVI